MSDCSLLTPLRRDGTSQRQRMPKALDPCAAPIDGRPTAELLLHSAELARLLRFYSEENVPKGNWSAFLEHDVSTMTARVGSYDADAAKEEFDEWYGAATVPATFAVAFPKMVARVFALAKMFEEWRRGSLDGLQLRIRLDRVIEGVLADALRNTIRVAKAVPAPVTVTLPSFATFDEVWGNVDPPADVALFASPPTPDNERAAVTIVALAFERFHETARRLAADAPDFLADTLTNHPHHRPHVALFLAFLRLFNRARHAMNSLTGSHLDYYYREVLQLVPRGPVADRVHVIFELAKNLPPHRVAEDSLLNAGKDATGVPLYYGTDAEIVVNRASVHPEHGLKTVFVDVGPEPGNIVRNVHAAGDADSDANAPPVNGEKRWPTLGNATLPFARVGFAIASPLFWLAEGRRTIEIDFDLLPSSNLMAGRPAADLEMVRRELEANVVVEATGPKGWIAVTPSVTMRSTLRYLQYSITFPASEPPVVGFDPAIHLETFDTTLPVLRFVMKNDGLPSEFISRLSTIQDYSAEATLYPTHQLVRFEGRVYEALQQIETAGMAPATNPSSWRAIEYACPYKYFAGMHIEAITLTVRVRDMRNVILENDGGPIKPGKPFQPFGRIPHIGSALLVGSWEIFQKPLKSLTIEMNWLGLPATSFADYYAGYSVIGATSVSNGSFTADVEILRNGDWPAAAGDNANQELFGIGTGEPDDALTVGVAFGSGGLLAQPSLERFRRFEPGMDRGFVRLKLNKSFLHDLYPAAMVAHANTVSAYAIRLAAYLKQLPTTPPAAGASNPPLPTPQPGPMPNPPYTPVASDLKVTYTAGEEINYASLTRQQVEDRVERLFHLGPFGYQEFAPISPGAAIPGVEPATSPVPTFTVKNDDAATIAEGTLYLGVANLTPPQNVSFLFQMAEGSEDPMLPAQDVQWGYLTATGWKDFSRPEILLDTTNELIASGILSVAIPKTATNTPTILPAGLHWLRATVARQTAAIPKTVAVLAQAMQASFRDGGNDPNHLANPLPAGTIAKLVERDAAIKLVSQPFSSFGRRMAESDRAFRIRVAERLRHKRRAVTIFDYERLVLERFPEVYKVRCLSHTDADSEYAPGSVRVVVMPNLRNRNAVDPLRPRLALSRLEEIRRDLAGMATDFADIKVVNPDYEEARVHTDVRFRTGFDVGFYTGQLERDIIRFLSPWLHDEGVDLAFGGRVHRSAILNFIEEREYVDFVANFTMDHIIPGATAAETRTRVDVEEAEPTKSSAVIVPAPTHAIGDDIVSCHDATGTST